MRAQEVVRLFLIVATAGNFLSADEPAPAPQKPPVVHELVAEQFVVNLEFDESAPAGSFKQGPCLIVLGLYPIPKDPEQSLLLGFELQRQEFSSKPTDPEKADWKEIKLEDAYDVLETVTAFEADVVDPKLTSPFITMPLSFLDSDEGWPELAAHPRLRKGAKNPPKYIVMFRYIDFTVKPGRMYRYRVRLEHVDPADENQQRTVWSDWSKPTELKEIKAPDKMP